MFFRVLVYTNISCLNVNIKLLLVVMIVIGLSSVHDKKLADHNRFQLVCVLGQMGIDGNEIADQLVREGSSRPLTGPDPALGISPKVARGVITDWTRRKHEECCQSIRGQRHAKGVLKKPSVKKAGELLSLN